MAGNLDCQCAVRFVISGKHGKILYPYSLQMEVPVASEWEIGSSRMRDCYITRLLPASLLRLCFAECFDGSAGFGMVAGRTACTRMASAEPGRISARLHSPIETTGHFFLCGVTSFAKSHTELAIEASL